MSSAVANIIDHTGILIEDWAGQEPWELSLNFMLYSQIYAQLMMQMDHRLCKEKF